MSELTLPITGMTCTNCSNTVERNLKKMPGIITVNVNYAAEQVICSFDPKLLKIKDIIIDMITPTIRMTVYGNKDLKSEVVIAYEIGYRFRPSSQFLLDTSIFYNDYDYLGTNELVSLNLFHHQ